MPRALAEAAYGRAEVVARRDALVDKANCEFCREVFEGCRVFLRYNADVSRGLANGARGRVIKLDEDGNPVVDFEGGAGECLVRQIAKTVYLDDYPPARRADIEEGRSREDPGRPVARVDYWVYPLSTGFATTPWCIQGKTLDTVVYDPAASEDYRDAWVPQQAFYVVVSRGDVSRNPVDTRLSFKLCRGDDDPPDRKTGP